MTSIRSALAAIVVGATLVAFPAAAADPPAGSISASSPTFDWSGTILAPSLNTCIGTNLNCDDFFLSVDHTGSWQAEVSIEPVDSSQPLLDIDLFVYDAAGNLLGESTTSTPYETVKFVGPAGGGSYRIQVSVWRGTSVMTGYTGRAIFLRSLECLDQPLQQERRAGGSQLHDAAFEQSSSLRELREVVAVSGGTQDPSPKVVEALAKASMVWNGFKTLDQKALNASSGSSSYVLNTSDVDGDGRAEVIAADYQPGNVLLELRDGATGSLPVAKAGQGLYLLRDCRYDRR